VLFSLSAFARDRNQHTIEISDAVQVGSTQLKPGTYRVEWQGTGPDVQVTFLRNGKTVATVPGTLKSNDNTVVRDDQILGNETNSANKTLDEIDFARDKQALVFQQSGM
jgi:hypothetical protein